MSFDKNIDNIRSGKDPFMICRALSGWILFGPRQYIKGHCILVADPLVFSINDLDLKARGIFLQDMILLGDALMRVTDAYRMNYEILGNKDPVLHAHLFPRYENEPKIIQGEPVWRAKKSDWLKYGRDIKKDADFMRDIKREFQDLYKKHGIEL